MELPNSSDKPRRSESLVVIPALACLFAVLRAALIFRGGVDVAKIIIVLSAVPIFVVCYLAWGACGGRRPRRAWARFGPNAWAAQAGLPRSVDARRTLVIVQLGIYLLLLNGKIDESWPWSTVRSADTARVTPDGAFGSWTGVRLSMVDGDVHEFGVANPPTLIYTRAMAQVAVDKINPHLRRRTSTSQPDATV